MSSQAEYADLLALADDEIRQLRADLSAARRAGDSLLAENSELYRRLLALTPPPPDPPLAGLRIGVIGHPSREADYRLVVERLGGQLLFAEARDKLGLIDRVVQRAHGCVYITAWGSHKASQRAEAAAARYGRPLVLTDQAGLAAVERAVLGELFPRMATTK